MSNIQFFSLLIGGIAAFLGAVKMISEAIRKPAPPAKHSPHEVYDLKFEQGEKVMEELKEAVAKLCGTCADLEKEVAENRHGYNNVKTVLNGLKDKIDEMPTEFIALLRSLGIIT